MTQNGRVIFFAFLRPKLTIFEVKPSIRRLAYGTIARTHSIKCFLVVKFKQNGCDELHSLAYSLRKGLLFLLNNILYFKAFASRNTMHIVCIPINFWDIFKQNKTAVKWKTS